jgi:hypothetical protein
MLKKIVATNTLEMLAVADRVSTIIGTRTGSVLSVVMAVEVAAALVHKVSAIWTFCH